MDCKPHTDGHRSWEMGGTHSPKNFSPEGGGVKYDAVLLRNSVQLGLVVKPDTGCPYGKVDAAEYASCSTEAQTSDDPSQSHFRADLSLSA